MSDHQQAEIERLQRLAVHCPDCGGDYAATGLEVGCPCKLRAVMDGLVEALRAKMAISETHKPRKLDEALTWRANDERVQQMCEAALEAARPFLEKS
jgi:hypothetical protein